MPTKTSDKKIVADIKHRKVPIDLQTYLKHTMSKELKLTIQERIAAAGIFDQFKGSITQLAAILDDVKTIAVTPDEWKAVNLVKTPVEGGRENWQWDPALDEQNAKTVSMSQEAADYLAKEIKTRSDEGTLSLADKGIVSLYKKLT